MNTNVKANRTYKSSVFELLYRDKDNLLELYNGLNGTDYHDPELELKVTMLNINLGHNRELMKKCSTLYQYALLIDLIRHNAKHMPIDEAVDHAVTECIKKDILRDFLSSQRSEVVTMSILEWNEEIEMEKLRRSERAGARAEGLAEGRAEGESLFALLASHLLADSRINELQKATSDLNLRTQLYKQYGLLQFNQENQEKETIE